MSDVVNRLVLPDASTREFDQQTQAGAIGWVKVPFDKANFAGVANMSWTVAEGNQESHQYVMFGPTLMIWQARILNTTIGGTLTTTVRIRIPGPRTFARNLAGWGNVTDNGTRIAARVVSDKLGGNLVFIQRSDSGNFSASSRATSFELGGIFEVCN